MYVVRETISQRNAEQNGETITPTKYAKTNEHKPIPQMASVGVQRWALTLAAYEYLIVHKAGTAHANADALSS